MSKEKKRSLFYVYVEYCPGDFFWGWWFYIAPVVDGLPRRRDEVGGLWEWMRPGSMGLEHLLTALGVEWSHDVSPPYHVDNDRAVDEFLRRYPNGALVFDGEPYVHYKMTAGAMQGETSVEHWRCLKAVRESQLLDWKESDDGPETARLRALCGRLEAERAAALAEAAGQQLLREDPERNRKRECIVPDVERLPEGWALVTEGDVRDNDLVWEASGAWAVIDPAPNQINPGPVSSLHGVARKVGDARLDG